MSSINLEQFGPLPLRSENYNSPHSKINLFPRLEGGAPALAAPTDYAYTTPKCWEKSLCEKQLYNAASER